MECPCDCHDHKEPSGHDGLCCEFPNGRKKENPGKLMRDDESIPKMAFVDYGVAENCKNKKQSYGEICVKCGKCGRKFKGGILISDSKKDFIESKSIKLSNDLLGNIEYGDSRDNKEWNKKVLESSSNIISSSLNEAWEKADKIGYKRGFIDEGGEEWGKDCNRRMFDQWEKEIRQQEREEIIKWTEDKKRNFREKLKKSFDAGEIAHWHGMIGLIQDILTHLKNI